MENIQELLDTLEKAGNAQEHSYRFLAALILKLPDKAFPPHVSRQLISLLNQSLQLREQLMVMLTALPTFEQPPRTDL